MSANTIVHGNTIGIEMNGLARAKRTNTTEHVHFSSDSSRFLVIKFVRFVPYAVACETVCCNPHINVGLNKFRPFCI